MSVLLYLLRTVKGFITKVLLEIVFFEWLWIPKLIGITIEQYFMDHNSKGKNIRFFIEQPSIYRCDHLWRSIEEGVFRFMSLFTNFVMIRLTKINKLTNHSFEYNNVGLFNIQMNNSMISNKPESL